MATNNLLEGKKILAVDDEADVLEVIADTLDMCEVDKATTFDEAKRKLDAGTYDLAIFDIMGVDGFKLLEIAREKGILSIMLTAHALSPENTVKAYEGGAASYVPKEHLSKIAVYLNSSLEMRAKGRHPWADWLQKLDSLFARKFGSDWKEGQKEFINKLKEHSQKD